VFRDRGEGIHMRASLICSSNDTIAKAGVILSGLLVVLLASPLPDLIIAVAIALLVLRGGLRILHEVHQSGRPCTTRSDKGRPYPPSPASLSTVSQAAM
jgi:Co/Zn/Cd efflux system component